MTQPKGRARRKAPCAEKVEDRLTAVDATLLKHAHDIGRIDRESRDRDWQLHQRINQLGDEVLKRVDEAMERQHAKFLVSLDERLKGEKA